MSSQGAPELLFSWLKRLRGAITHEVDVETLADGGVTIGQEARRWFRGRGIPHPRPFSRTLAPEKASKRPFRTCFGSVSVPKPAGRHRFRCRGALRERALRVESWTSPRSIAPVGRDAWTWPWKPFEVDEHMLKKAERPTETIKTSCKKHKNRRKEHHTVAHRGQKQHNVTI